MDDTHNRKTHGSSADKFALAHEILVLDAFLQHPLDCGHRERITRSFITELLGVLGMEPLAPLAIYPAVDQRAPGWSFIQPITTSHVSAHYFEKPGPRPHIRIDAYSCDAIAWRKLIAVCHKHFALDRWRATFIDRQIDANARRSVLDLSGCGSHIVGARPVDPQVSAGGGQYAYR